MIEAFCSVYRKDYRDHDREPEVERAKPCLYYNDLVENFLPQEDSKAIYHAERDDAVIKEKSLKTLVSTYQSSYCCNITKRSLVIDPDNLDDDPFIVHFNQYYGKKTRPVPRPLETSRRVNGYSRFDYYYTRRTELEESIGRSAYEYFKKNYDEGKNRLFGKKQKASHQKKVKTWEEKPEVVEEPKLEMEASQKESMSPQVNEKICGLCCEKFGDFTYQSENGASE